MTRLNKLVLLVFAAMVLAEASGYAQEREPLAMRIELEWTVAWSVVGALAGAALWLTDPGNPNLSLARQSIEGAALGAFVGAGFGLYVMQRSIQYPQNAALETPPALWGTGADPVTVRERSEQLMASAPPAHPSFTLAAYRLNF
jgi:hypothetical protein